MLIPGGVGVFSFEQFCLGWSPYGDVKLASYRDMLLLPTYIEQQRFSDVPKPPATLEASHSLRQRVKDMSSH